MTTKERVMPLIGIIAKKREIQIISKELKESNIKIIQITKESIKNVKNICFEEIIVLEDIKLEADEYKYMNEIISKTKYLVLNGDIKIEFLKKMNMEKPMKVITFGFNTKATISISSVKEEKIIVCLQRDIEKLNGEIIESQEKEIKLIRENDKKIYTKLVIFIIKELHNL